MAMAMSRRRNNDWLGLLVSLSHRLWWWLAIVSLLSLLGQEFFRSAAGYGAALTADAAELEGFGDETEEEGEEEVPDILSRPAPGAKPGPQTDRGPPAYAEGIPAAEQAEDGGGKNLKRGDDGGEGRKRERSSAEGGGRSAPGPSVATTAQEGAKRVQQLWDEEEFEGLPDAMVGSSWGEGGGAAGGEEGRRSVMGGGGGAIPSSESQNQSGARRRGAKEGTGRGRGGGPSWGNMAHQGGGGISNYLTEIGVIIFLIAYVINFFIGRKANEKIAVAWAEQFAGRESIIEKNFSLIGVGSSLPALSGGENAGLGGEVGEGGGGGGEGGCNVSGEEEALMLKEGQNIFKFYASGRRFCEGLLATLDLRGRHDLLLLLWYFFSPRKDLITIEVDMNDEDMDPVVFAVARRKSAKSMHKENKDLQQYATMLELSMKKNWPSDEFSVVAESRELALDLLPDALVDQVFSEKARKFSEHLVSMHFTDQNADPLHKKMLRFTFSLPEPDKMADLSRLMHIVPYYIDIIGRHKLSAQARAKAEAARLKVAQEAHKESHNARQEALQRKRADRLAAMKEAESALSREALRRKEEKNRARELKRGMPRIRISRAH